MPTGAAAAAVAAAAEAVPGRRWPDPGVEGVEEVEARFFEAAAATDALRTARPRQYSSSRLEKSDESCGSQSCSGVVGSARNLPKCSDAYSLIEFRSETGALRTRNRSSQPSAERRDTLRVARQRLQKGLSNSGEPMCDMLAQVTPVCASTFAAAGLDLTQPLQEDAPANLPPILLQLVLRSGSDDAEALAGRGVVGSARHAARRAFPALLLTARANRGAQGVDGAGQLGVVRLAPARPF